MPTTDAQWLDWLGKSGGTGAVFLGIFVLGLIRGWWYLGREFRDEREERLEWKRAAMTNVPMAARSVDAAASAVNILKESLR